MTHTTQFYIVLAFMMAVSAITQLFIGEVDGVTTVLLLPLILTAFYFSASILDNHEERFKKLEKRITELEERSKPNDP